VTGVQTCALPILMNKGEIAEQGTHQELLELPDGLYRQSWGKQSGFQLSADGYHAEVRAERLRMFPVFSEMDDAFLGEIAPYFATESYNRERFIIHEGDHGDKFYIIVRGKVEVMKKDEAGNHNRVAVFFDGDFFGEMALLHNIPRTASIRTLTPVVFITLQRDFFQSLLQRAPHLVEKLDVRLK
jgi:ATP-binding cassette, subfamily B, bacterial